ncbi:MAG: leucine-rich repeat protein [Clostridia bacterium]|nr:leucine-rich repeat protein [Clostridia bacterium]
MFDIIDNVLLQKYHGNEALVTVPDGVKVIGNAAFQDNQLLEEISLPKGIELIEQQAFAGCHALRRVNLPMSLKKIDCYGFSWCDSLHQIEIPGGTYVEEKTFFCTPLDRATLHKRSDGNSGLLDTKLRLAAGLCPFCETGRLIYSADRHNAKCDSCGGTLDEEQRRKMKKLDVRNSVLLGGEDDGFLSIPMGIKRIQSRAFDDSFIRGVEIPSSVTEIGVGAFAWCDRMQQVRLPSGLKRIEASCFNLATIENISIPPATEYIGRHAFSGAAIRTVLFNDQLKVIGACGFAHAPNLKAVALPEGLEILGAYAFSNCESLEAVVVPGSVASIETGTFQNCERLQNVIIKEGVTHIGDDAFKECISLQKLVLPDSLLLIGIDAFASCDMLLDVELPLQLKGMCESAFPSHTKIHYRAFSEPNEVEGLIQSLTEADWIHRHEAMKAIEKLAEEGNVAAMMHLAKCSQFGHYTKRSEPVAFYWVEKAAKRGCLRAKWMLFTKRNPYESSYRVDLLRLVRAGCEEAIRSYAAYRDE